VSSTLAVGIMALGALVLVGFLFYANNRRRSRFEDVPPAMRPAYSDEELERGHLESLMQWGLVLTALLAVFLPVYWLNERPRLQSEREDFFVAAVERGDTLYQANCSTCHSPNLAGGAAPSPYGGESWPAPALNNIVTRYADSRSIQDVHDFIVLTLQRGRPGTPMPTWGAAYGGPMTDQNIEDIADYILANQVAEVTQVQPVANDVTGEQLFQENCAKCHGADLEAGDGRPGPPLIGVLERHSPDTILGILNNGIFRAGQAVMPGFGTGQYQYEGARYDEEALRSIIEYIEDQQPATLPEGAEQWQTPGLGNPADAQSEAEATPSETTEPETSR
jgi:mono/diheme cytochrome c family protein